VQVERASAFVSVLYFAFDSGLLPRYSALPTLAAVFSLTSRRRNRFLPSLAATTPLFLPPPIFPSFVAALCRFFRCITNFLQAVDWT
jgi:hypothetical protein